MSKKEFNIWQCVSKDYTKYFMTGVYYENGFRVATDGRMLAVIKGDYPDDYEKTIRDQNGDEINGQFPNYKRVIPDIEDMAEVSRPALCDIEMAYHLPTKGGVKVEKFIFAPKVWKAIYNFIDLWRNDIEVYIAKDKPGEKAVVFKAGDNLLVAMQCSSANCGVMPGSCVANLESEPKAEPKTYTCDGNENHVALKVTYKQLKEVCPNVLTVGKSDILNNLTPMCTTWGQNGWNVLAYDFVGAIITSGEGANGIHIPADYIKKAEKAIDNLRAEGNGAIDVDKYKELIDEFFNHVAGWWNAKMANDMKKASVA